MASASCRARRDESSDIRESREARLSRKRRNSAPGKRKPSRAASHAAITNIPEDVVLAEQDRASQPEILGPSKRAGQEEFVDVQHDVRGMRSRCRTRVRNGTRSGGKTPVGLTTSRGNGRLYNLFKAEAYEELLGGVKLPC
ncbi:unnamed protein product [Cylicocyclus nassatus]|uniref:Uncharacterized protein n=1 Tax=Cylicocyclus nassatus TaxID=53992 RepID=A0AA36H3T4_CYLNA|nr:unnamed protein product [Cylicocyclus nassatus]